MCDGSLESNDEVDGPRSSQHRAMALDQHCLASLAHRIYLADPLIRWLELTLRHAESQQAGAPTSNKDTLSQSSTPSLVHRRYAPRSLEPIVRPPPASYRVSSTAQQRRTPQCDWRKEYSPKITHGNASVITRDQRINTAHMR
jgi:hypothetical protein